VTALIASLRDQEQLLLQTIATFQLTVEQPQ